MPSAANIEIAEEKGSDALHSIQPGESSQASENLEGDKIEPHHQTTQSSKAISKANQKRIAIRPQLPEIKMVTL